MDYTNYADDIARSFRESWSGSPLFWETFLIALAVLACVLAIYGMRKFFASLPFRAIHFGTPKLYKLNRQESTTLALLHERRSPITLYTEEIASDRLAGVFRIREIEAGRLICSADRGFDLAKLKPGQRVVCLFAPLSTDGERTNAFFTTLRAIVPTRTGGGFVLEGPRNYGSVQKRKYKRVRIMHQEQIRVEAWAAQERPHSLADVKCPPSLAANPCHTDDERQTGNSVINISRGGIALSLHSGLAASLRPGSRLVLYISIFRSREQAFRSFTYTGRVRSVKKADATFTRIGIQFMEKAALAEDGTFAWSGVK